MKKSIFILALVLVLVFSFAFSISSFAYDNTVTLSEDYSTLYLNGKTYSKANTEAVNLNVYADGKVFTSDFGIEDDSYVNFQERLNLQLTDSQKAELTKAYISMLGESKLFADVELSFKDGTTIWYSYVRDDVKDDFNQIKNGKNNEYVIKFETYSDHGDILKTVPKKNLLTSDMEMVLFDYCEQYSVAITSEKYGYSVDMGCILIDTDYIDDKNSYYYYFDFAETGITSIYDLYETNNYTKLSVHKITDEETIAIIEEGLDEYYNSDFGYIYNEEFTEPVAKIFFTLVFAIFPLAIAVLTIILAVKSKKGLYKKLLIATSGLSLASLAVFIYIAFTLFNK